MHVLFIIACLLIAFVGCLACWRLLRSTGSLRARRLIQLVGLFLPTLTLLLLGTLMAHFVAHICFLAAPPPDVLISEALMFAGATSISLAVLLNLARAALLPIHLRRHTWCAPPEMQARVADLARHMRLRRSPRTLVAADVRAWALVAGLFRPQLALSSGLVALLDAEELDAALCHELLHIRRGDLWWTALCGVLRDLTWFLPTTRCLYRQMLAEQEIACDDHLVGEAPRLALASALVRVWQQGLGSAPARRGALALFSPQQADQLENRVRRLMDKPISSQNTKSHMALAVVAALFLLFLVAQVLAAAVAMLAMGCGIGTHSMM